jgi:hypothetical protein
MRNSFVLGWSALMSVTMNNSKDAINAKGRLALGDSKKRRSLQYSTNHTAMAIGIAR